MAARPSSAWRYRPYLFPLYTPAGFAVTSESPADHPHHNSFWIASDHLHCWMPAADGRREEYTYNFYLDETFQGRATITTIPASLAQAMQITLALPVQGEGQAAAQRAIVASLENALEARRQRILISQSEVNPVKWLSLIVQAICMLTTIAMVHVDNRTTAAIAMGVFSTAIAVCIMLITAHDRPFVGPNAVQPTVLLQMQPDASANTGR